MGFLGHMFKGHKQAVTLILAVVAIILIIGVSRIFATPPGSPYAVGETLTPTCAPETTNCYVEIGGGGGGTSIGGTVTGGTPGSALFVGSASSLSEDNPNYFWDNDTDRLGIRTNSPQSELNIVAQHAGGLQLNNSIGAKTAEFKNADGYGGYIQMFDDNGDQKIRLSADGGVPNWIITPSYFGIGTNDPQAKLYVNGTFRLTDGSQGAGKVLTSDATGTASWQTPGGGGGTSQWTDVSGGIAYNGGRVGISTTAPQSQLNLLAQHGDGLQLNNSLGTKTAEFKNADSYGGYIQMFTDNGDHTVRISADGGVANWITTPSNFGLGTTNPQGKLHVKRADSGAGIFAGSLQPFVLENNDHTWVSILTPNDKSAGLIAADPENVAAGEWSYAHGMDVWRGFIQNQNVFFLNSTGLRVGPNNGQEVPTATLDINGNLRVSNVPEYADNTAATSAGLAPGAFYRTGDILKVVH
jgi:hypothetical protein